MKTLYLPISVLVGTLILAGCTREFLDIKPDKSQVVPSKPEHFQMLLDNYSQMSIYWPSIGEIAADNLYMGYTDWEALPDITAKNAHIWGNDLFNDRENNDWTYAYISVFYANVVLEGINKIKNENNDPALNDIKGQALFFRAYAFYQLAQLFAKPFDDASASQDPGIPLRLSADLNVPSERASVKETYDRIIIDARAAADLLPAQSPYKTRPSRAATFGLLARTYLSMAKYDDALKYADSCLQIQNTLLDYNLLDSTSSYPVPRFNEEIIFFSLMALHTSFLTPTRSRIDSNLYMSYSSDDLRKKIFFRPADKGMAFKGSYRGSSALFNGIAVDEMLLIRAECLARSGKKPEALNDLNRLLEKRWTNGTFVPVTASDQDEALAIILTERRKELLCRGLRWTDLRRLNKEVQHSVTIRRVMNGHTYVLKPNSPLYVFPIPNAVINSTGMPQNPR